MERELASLRRHSWCRGWIPTQAASCQFPGSQHLTGLRRPAPPRSQQGGSHAPLHQDEHEPCPSVAAGESWPPGEGAPASCRQGWPCSQQGACWLCVSPSVCAPIPVLSLPLRACLCLSFPGTCAHNPCSPLALTGLWMPTCSPRSLAPLLAVVAQKEAVKGPGMAEPKLDQGLGSGGDHCAQNSFPAVAFLSVSSSWPLEERDSSPIYRGN